MRKTRQGQSISTSLHGLPERHKEILIALARATRYSPRAHVPIHAVLSKYAFHDRRNVKRALIEVSRMGLVTKHPTCTEMTFHITKLGLSIVGSYDKKMGNS
jgi:hypothetical protein